MGVILIIYSVHRDLSHYSMGKIISQFDDYIFSMEGSYPKAMTSRLEILLGASWDLVDWQSWGASSWYFFWHNFSIIFSPILLSLELLVGDRVILYTTIPRWYRSSRSGGFQEQLFRVSTWWGMFKRKISFVAQLKQEEEYLLWLARWLCHMLEVGVVKS